MKANLTVTALLCCLLLAAPAFAAPPQASEREDKFVLENEHVTVWFQGKKPMLKVFPTANASDDGNVSGAYSYKFSEVVEFRDLDGDGAPSGNEVVARLDLDKASGWSVNRSEADDGAVVLNLSLAAQPKLGPKTDGVPVPEDVGNLSLPDREAEVRLVFTLREGATTLQAGDENVTVPATSVKYDFEVVRWPFVDAASNRLALVAQVEGELETNGTEADSATVSANETALGIVTWLPTAQGTLANGTAVEVPVRTTLRTEGNQTRLVHAYDAAGLATLLHDPTIGVTPTPESLEATGEDGSGEQDRNTVPGAGLLSGLAVAGAAALALRRRRA